MAKNHKKWRFIAGGAIEPLIHKKIWVETFLDYLNSNKYPRSYLVIRKNNWAAEYGLVSDSKELFKVSKKFINPKYFAEFLESSRLARRKFWEIAGKFKKVNSNEFTKKELEHWFKEYLELFRSIAIHFWATQPEFFQYPEKIFREDLQGRIKTNAKLEEAIAVLTSPTKLNIVEEEEIDLINLTRKPPSKEKIIAHANRYPWLFFNTFDEKKALNFLSHKVGKADYRSSYKADLLKNKKKLRRKQKVILRRLNSKKIAYLSSFFKEIAIERFRLKACWAGATFLLLPLFERIARELKISVKELLWFWRSEDILKRLRDNCIVTRKEIQRRAISYSILLNKGNIRFSSGKEALEIIGKKLGKDFFVNPKIKKLRGVVASYGKVQGIARVIHIENLEKLNRDWKNFRKGEIMIVSMTQPNMMPIIRKAAAVVTDEGGITSHAAIICRELKIPCIVGTGNATLMFNTGDKIFVDAEKGFVSLIK